MKRLFSIRGAITCENTEVSITEKTLELCENIFIKNDLLDENDFVNIHFTMTNDLDSKNPCAALRKECKTLDISKIPLFCSQEAYIQNGLKKVIRVMVTVYMEETKVPINVYLDGAKVLRPDIK